jgi:hypothetical protein
MPAAWQLVDRSTGASVVESLELADGFWTRLAGLQFRKSLSAEQGLLLVPCSSVHSCCVRFPLDIAMLDRAGQVLRVRRGVRPWRLVFAPRRTHAVLEMPAGSERVFPGQWLSIRGLPDEDLPKSLQFLRA